MNENPLVQEVEAKKAPRQAFIQTIRKQLDYINSRLSYFLSNSLYNKDFGEYKSEFEALGYILYALEPLKDDPELGYYERDTYRRYAEMRNSNRYSKLQRAKHLLIQYNVLDCDPDHGVDNYPIDYRTRF